MKYLIAFIFLVLSAPAHTFKLSPLAVTIWPDKNQMSNQVYVENSSSDPIALQVTISQRIADKNGVETHPVVKDLFQIYPEQLILKPLEKRAIKVFWKGDKIVSRELPFRIIVEQLPLELGKNELPTNIKILLRYVGSVYIRNLKHQPNVVVKDWRISNQSIQLDVENTGTAHQLLYQLKVFFVSKKGEKTIELNNESDLKGMIGENILPGNVRTFNLHSDLKIDPKEYEVRLEYKDGP